MKKFLLLFAFVATLCACERRFPGYRETTMPLELESDSSGIPLSELSPEPYLLQLQDRPDSVTVATAEYDELWVMAHPLSLRDEVLGLIERETPLGMVFYFIGVCLVTLVALTLIFRLAFFLVDLIAYRGVSNSRSRDRADGGCRYVDLGLPSGTRWAVENAVMDGKTHFSFEEAVKTFGNELPSTEAWKELFDHCKREWNEKHKGYTLTGPNGNTLFLPAAGCRHRSSLHYVGSIGYYWSSSADSESNALGVQFCSGYVLPQDYLSRYGRLSVRLCKTK